MRNFDRISFEKKKKIEIDFDFDDIAVLILDVSCQQRRNFVVVRPFSSARTITCCKSCDALCLAQWKFPNMVGRLSCDTLINLCFLRGTIHESSKVIHLVLHSTGDIL